MMLFRIKNKSFIYLLAMPSAAIILGGLALYMVELRVNEPSINDIGDAFWLAITTITTVGYGEIYPVTLEGRIISGILLLTGVLTIFGFLTTIGAKIIEPMLEVKNKKQDKESKGIKQNGKTDFLINDRSDDNSDKEISKNIEKEYDWLKQQIDRLDKLDNREFIYLISILVSHYQNMKIR